MRILIAHNRYQQAGGEDVMVEAESALLRSHGHTVHRLNVDNDRIQGTLVQIKASVASIYSRPSKQLMRRSIEETKPHIVHIHNFFPTFSPSIFYACHEANIPVVHTLHNYRIVCAASTLFRDGHLCEECITDRSPMPGVRHACYRQSKIGSAVSGWGMTLHDEVGTWSSKVAAFIALNEVAASKFGSFRIPKEKIHVKQNFAVDRGLGTGDGGYALFAGRLTPEKGIQTLIDADASGSLCMDIVILGDGPLRQQLQRASERPGSRLICKGFRKQEEIVEHMKRASVLIMPSIWYEGGPLVAIEAMSMGLPVIGADIGNVSHLISSTGGGLLYRPGDHLDLSAKLAEFAANPVAVAAMRANARRAYLARHTPEANYLRLTQIYESVLVNPSHA